ncbi:MAG: hypothetical protein ACJ795_13170 [Ktedonobacteraceae bacterium]
MTMFLPVDGFFSILLLCLVALLLVGFGFFLGRRSSEQRRIPFPVGEMPNQQGYDPDINAGPYAASGQREQGYGRGYPFPQGQGYPPQQGMSPWAAGGLGALGGGLLGYGIGQTMTGDEQTPSDSSVVNEDANPSDTQSGNQEDVVPLGDNVTAGNFTDFGASGEGFDVGGGDLGGSESW